MLKKTLYWIVGIIADIHTELLSLNNSFEMNFTDKQLHFLVIGILGMAIFLVVDPVFRWLARRGWESVISWIYTMTLIVVLTFAIEIGQHITGTGVMEFADIVFGIVGFFAMFFVYAVVRLLIWAVRRLFGKITA